MKVRGQLGRWCVLAALSVATLLVLGVSLRGNFLYGYGLGQTEEKKLLFAWANVGIDLWKSFGLIAVGLLWRTRQRRAAIGAAMSWVLCLLFGINSALGVYVQDRTALVGGKEATSATYRERENELARIEVRLRNRMAQRSTREIEAEIASILARGVVIGDRLRGTIGSISHQCTKLDVRTREACERMRELQRDLASTAETETLEARATVLRKEIEQLRERGGSLTPDPVAEFYNWLTGGFVDARDVGFGFPLFFALLIETVSAFGPATIAAYAEASRMTCSGAPRQALTGYDAPRPAQAGDGTLRRDVLEWIAARAMPTPNNRALGLSELHADYARWCDAGEREPVAIAAFEHAFDAVRDLPELAGKIGKFGSRYYGIGLVQPRLAAKG
jgi:cell division protein FtsB